ncbi:MAG: FAD-binding protein, partial [Acidobacteriota bacterium]|nr:FAD-binding protein [Acidobacteriota bacterium]
MAIAIDQNRCNKCGVCKKACPFGAIEIIDIANGYPVLNAACKMCGICIPACRQSAIIEIDDVRQVVDKEAWQGILVFGETTGENLHPVVRELVGKALQLAGRAPAGADMTQGDMAGCEVSAVVIGNCTGHAAGELLTYGVDKVFSYEHDAFGYFKADSFAVCFADAIGHIHPAIVLTGATSVGRSLAPRVSTRLRTGLTADCTGLELNKEGDLVQTRPAFGGNIMAEIITPNSRPQFATVRYKVMDQAEIVKPHGGIIHMAVTEAMIRSGIEPVSAESKPPAENISEAEILVVGGKGLKAKDDLKMISALAEKLGGQYAVTRPLVEAGWAPQNRQIGLSGRTVKPKLLITFG